MATTHTPSPIDSVAPPTPSHREIGLRLVAYLLPYRTKLIIGLLCGLVGGYVPLVVAWMIGEFIGSAVLHESGRVTLICGGVIALYAMLWILNYTQSVLLAEVAQRIGVQMRMDVYAHLQSLSLSYFHKRRTGELMSTLTSDIPKLQDAAMMIRSVITSPIQAVSLLVFLLFLSWKLTFFVLLLIPAMWGVIQLITRQMRSISNESQAKLAEVNAVLEETLSASRIIRAFASEKREIKRYARVNEEAVNISMRGVRRAARLGPTIDLLGAITTALAIWFGGQEVAQGHLDIKNFVKFLFAAITLSNTIGSIGNIRSSWEAMMGAADRIFHDVLGTVPEVRDAPDAKPLPPIKGSVEFDEVSFAYDPKAVTPTLSHINLTIEPGQVVALVGETGAGKSTLADLVPRFYDPTGGVIRIDGYDIKTVTMESLRRQIGIVPQETLLFSGSIKSNIAYGKQDATDAEIEAAARAANADSFIQSFPAKYETIIGERGATLSGGERQRVAIARALLADPRLLILDEATSALDAATEALVQEALEVLMQNRTTIIIAHRLSTIVKADKIVVLRRGGIIAEVGTHSELIARRGVYSALYETQQRSAELVLPEP